jgi:hypothetical protein
MLLIVEPPNQRVERGEAAGREVYDQMVRFAADLKERGKLVAVESLTSQKDAVRVQVRGGQPKVLDGPFAEAKEMIGGFFLLTAKPVKKPWRSRRPARRRRGARSKSASSGLVSCRPPRVGCVVRGVSLGRGVACRSGHALLVV